MNKELKIKDKITTNEWLLDHCSIDGLESHNRSLEWLIETAERLDATIDTRITDGYSSQGFCFAIQLKGRHSGVLYRIKVTFNPKMARLLGKRAGDFVVEEGYLLHPFRNMVEFESFWFDHRKEDWERVCVIRAGDSDCFWPFDSVVSLMEALNNDLDTALQMGMDTLRKSLIDSYPISWFNGNTDIGLMWDEVQQYCYLLYHLQHIPDSEERYMEVLEDHREELQELGSAHIAREAASAEPPRQKAKGAE